MHSFQSGFPTQNLQSELMESQGVQQSQFSNSQQQYFQIPKHPQFQLPQQQQYQIPQQSQFPQQQIFQIPQQLQFQLHQNQGQQQQQQQIPQLYQQPSQIPQQHQQIHVPQQFHQQTQYPQQHHQQIQYPSQFQLPQPQPSFQYSEQQQQFGNGLIGNCAQAPTPPPIQYQPVPVFIPYFQNIQQPSIPPQQSQENSLPFSRGGEASPAAMRHLERTGLKYDTINKKIIPNSEESKKESSYPGIHFQPRKDPWMRALENDDSLALVNLESLAKYLRKSRSHEDNLNQRYWNDFDEYDRQGQQRKDSKLFQCLRKPHLQNSDLLLPKAKYEDEFVNFNTYKLKLTTGPPKDNSKKYPWDLTYEKPFKTNQNQAPISQRNNQIQNEAVWNHDYSYFNIPKRNEVTRSVTDLLHYAHGNHRRENFNNLYNPYTPNQNPTRQFSNQYLFKDSNQDCYGIFKGQNFNNNRPIGRVIDCGTYGQAFEEIAKKKEEVGTSILNQVNSNISIADYLGIDGGKEKKKSSQCQGQGFRSRVILTKRDYYCIPSVEELDRMTTDNGECIVRNFEVGHRNWGKIQFPEAFNVSGLDLDNIVEFGHKTVRVYPFGTSCPPVGQGLNRPAIIVLRKVYPTNVSKRTITDPEKLREMNYANRIRKQTADQGGTFVSYDDKTGDWTFRVPYFMA